MQLYDKGCIRIASLPLEPLLELNAKLVAIKPDNHDGIVAILKELYANELFAEAVFLSSEDVSGAFTRLKEEGFKNIDECRRLLVTSYKFFSRMSSRCTPYGLFAGVAAVGISNAPTEIVFAKERIKPKHLFNIHSVLSVLRQLPYKDENFSGVKYYVNNTLYILGDKMYYTEQVKKSDYYVSNLTSITLNKYLSEVIALARDGENLTQIASALQIDDVDWQTKLNFIHTLVEAQVLIPEFWPSVSSEDFVLDILNYFSSRNIITESIRQLSEDYEAFGNISTQHTLSNMRRGNYDRNDRSLFSNYKKFTKTDLFINLKSANINRKAIEKLSRDAASLVHLKKMQESEVLANFKDAFHAKFEAREIPLVQALDPNYGVGFGLVTTGVSEYTPLLNNILTFPNAPESYTVPITTFDKIRLKALSEYHQSGKTVIKIDDDIKEMIGQNKMQDGFTTSTYLFGSVLASDQQDVDNGNFKFVPIQLHAPFAAKLISRFAHGSVEIEKLAKNIAADEKENNKSKILAEVTTIVDADYANLCLTPQLRDYEIPYLSNSTLDISHQINIDDLMVSIANNRVHLRSRKFNKEVIPTITNTYNSNLAQPIYRFLSEVASQDLKMGDLWNWGIYGNHSFLPRIEYKNIVLSRATWILKTERIDYKNFTAVDDYISSLRLKHNIPQYVVFPESDNELLLDLDTWICRFFLAKKINNSDVALTECLHTPENCFIKNEGFTYTNELILPLRSSRPVNGSEPMYSETGSLQRIFYPGSEWLYIKLYSGSKIIEQLLTEVIGDYAAELTSEETIDKWFFIRYNDPDYHIRVRFHRHHACDPIRWLSITENLQHTISKEIKEPHAVKIMIDTYHREIERYGEATMDLSEKIFCTDSIAIFNFLNLIHGNEGEELRWLFALVNIDMLLDAFDYVAENKLKLLKSVSEDFLYEFSRVEGSKNYVKKSLDDKYRQYKSKISQFIRKDLQMSEYMEAYECFEQRTVTIREHLAAHGKLEVSNMDGLMASYMHMSLNRLFMTHQRKHELVIYHFLTKYYQSEVAQLKKVTYEHQAG